MSSPAASPARPDTRRCPSRVTPPAATAIATAEGALAASSALPASRVTAQISA